MMMPIIQRRFAAASLAGADATSRGVLIGRVMRPQARAPRNLRGGAGRYPRDAPSPALRGSIAAPLARVLDFASCA